VREYLLAAGEHWIRFGVDGWRLDVPEDLEDPDFWREFRRRIRAIDPQAYILAEIWFPKAEVLRGDQYDATMYYPFLTAVVSFAAGSHLDLAVAAQHGWLGAAVRPLDGPGFAGLLGRLMTELDPDVVAVQYNLLGSHDTPRLLTIVGGDAASVRLAALVQATLPGAPAVYYGDEIGMTGSIDPAARAAFPWDRPDTWDDSIRAFLRAAFALRHEQPVLRDGSYRLAGAQGSMVAWVRVLDGVVALVVLNNGEAPATLALEAPELAGRRLRPVALPGDDAPAAFAPAPAAFDVSLPARTGRVYLGSA
jgi:neopullulanase